MIIRCKTFITFNDPFNVVTNDVSRQLKIYFPKSDMEFLFPISEQIPINKYNDLVEEVLNVFSHYWDCEYVGLDSVVEDATENIIKGV